MRATVPADCVMRPPPAVDCRTTPGVASLSDPAIDTPARTARRRLLAWALVLAGLLLLAGAWTWTPLREVVRPEPLAAWLVQLRGEPWVPLVVLAGFLVGGLLVLPVTLMVVLTVAGFGPVLGFVYALVGATASGMLSFAIGRVAGRRHVERLAGSRVYRFSARLGRHGLLAILLLRMVPVAHFTIISLTAGASHIRARDFFAGTLLGMAPGLLAIVVFFDRLAAFARDPAPLRFAGVLTAAAVIALGLYLVHRWARRRLRA